MPRTEDEKISGVFSGCVLRVCSNSNGCAVTLRSFSGCAVTGYYIPQIKRGSHCEVLNAQTNTSNACVLEQLGNLLRLVGVVQ
jgi:hypothetical protein